ncbi:ATP-utilizing chromatin assembly and remodelling N-terminal-domain-containing protein [Mycena rosella]|uniref:ATP-utilizing chromatin assembly and remodelling N-terminal-domain-containing protein n=1 Tax=Mycena rosella TaxID=1033263 RepID=A0AAD7G4U2_MYCRO|nr:ATP-utilizing chromatin assembly and remodelling N-terminal-domain-containing protein [Mycena rosella]
MPTCRRKRVVLTETSDALIHAAKTDPDRDVFYLHQTGEIFDSYETYAARMSFYRQKQFQCEVTGKSGLDYFQAVHSEKQEARTLHSRFSEPLKAAVLKSVQWQVMGRLDHLVEAVYERFKDRYFKDERVLVDLGGTKYYARIDKVFPPKYSNDTSARDAHKPNAASSSVSPIEDEDPPHALGGDLKEPVKDANARDDPKLYYYWVHIIELEKEKSHDKQKATAAKNAEKDGKMIDSLREVQCDMMSRDRLSFSKSILRRFIRDCVDREAAVASPWTVKPVIAKRYGVDSDMPEETRKGVETIKKGEIDKRKKVWEDKEQPPTKRQKKMTAAQEERAEKREREAAEKAILKEEADRIAAEKKKKKPLRYPTEDLDVRLGEKEIKAGTRVKRPVPSRVALPFNDTSGAFEAFLMTWNFIVVYGQALHISTFTLDEFEHAIQHSVVEPPCSLLAEIHSTLIYNLRTVPFQRHSALVSLLRLRDRLAEEGREDDKLYGVTVDELTAAMAEVGNNWERVPLRQSEGREGWEDALFGCLKDHATLINFPTLREVLTKLLFAPDLHVDPCSSPSGSRVSTPVPSVALTVVSNPVERYYALPPADRVAILSFMCNLAISSKAVHGHMEYCEEQLTALRKEKIEVNRLKKQYAEEMNVLRIEIKEDPLPPPPTNGVDQDVVMLDASDLSDVSGAETAPKKGKKGSKIPATGPSKQREAARAKQAAIKQATAEHRRLDEEVNKLERRLEGIEREFRKLLCTIRVKPLGKDRFHNRIWWFDGMGSGSLVGSGGVTQYGAGRLFIQGPSEFDVDLLSARTAEGIEERRQEEEGIEGMLGPGDWAVYSDQEELDEFMAWLNPKGHREVALKSVLTKWWPHITSGLRRRIADVNVNARLPEARRSTRTKSATGYDISREPYMVWTNRKAATAP